MSDATLHQCSETAKPSDADIKRSDADTVVGLGDSKNQAIARCAHCAPRCVIRGSRFAPPLGW